MRILVTGAAGMLGSALVPALARFGHELVVTDIQLTDRQPWGTDGPRLAELDVRSRSQVEDAVNQVRPDLVAHLAAETNVEDCERDPDHGFRTNAIGTKYVALTCQRYDIPLAYISTAGVFDGEKDGPYDEFDAPNPINIYGRSKFEGERLVRSLLERYYIIRAGWMVGGGIKDHKFVARILQQIRDGARTIHAVGDKLGTPTYAPDFAACLANVIDAEDYGLYHMACGGSGSRFDVAQHLVAVLGRDDIDVVEVDSSHFADEFFAPRPASEIMRNRALDLQGMNTMRPWMVALAEYLRTEFAELIDPAGRHLDATVDEQVIALEPSAGAPA